MKTIVLATVLALAAAAPALASPDTVHHPRASHHAMNHHAYVVPDIGGVYVDGQEIGRDPDPNIRSSLRDEYNQMQGD